MDRPPPSKLKSIRWISSSRPSRPAPRPVLLDNMAPPDLRRAVEMTAGRAALEASGRGNGRDGPGHCGDRCQLHLQWLDHPLGAGARTSA